jgi:hypothetical protein
VDHLVLRNSLYEERRTRQPSLCILHLCFFGERSSSDLLVRVGACVDDDPVVGEARHEGEAGR